MYVYCTDSEYDQCQGTDGAIKPRAEPWPTLEEDVAKEMQSTSRASPLLADPWHEGKKEPKKGRNGAEFVKQLINIKHCENFRISLTPCSDTCALFLWKAQIHFGKSINGLHLRHCPGVAHAACSR